MRNSIKAGAADKDNQRATSKEHEPLCEGVPYTVEQRVTPKERGLLCEDEPDKTKQSRG